MGTNNDDIETVKKAYGFSDHQLLNQFNQAAEESESKQIDSEAVKEGFKKLVDEIESRGITGYEKK